MSFYDREGEADAELGRAVRALPVPEHGAHFWADLEARWAAVADRPTVAIDGTVAEDVPTATQPAEVLSPQAKVRHRRPVLRAPAPERPKGRHRGRAMALASAVVAVAAGLTWVALDRQGEETVATGSPTPTAAGTEGEGDVAAPAAARWRGEVHVERTNDGGTSTERYQAVAGRDGGLLLTATEPAGGAHGFDPTIGTARDVAADGTAAVRTGLAPVPRGLPAEEVLWRDLVAFVVGRAAAGDPAVTEVHEAGRKAWRLVTPWQADLLGVGGADEVEVVVDQELLVPLHLVARAAGAPVEEVRLAIEPAAPGTATPDLYLPELPAAPVADDEGWRPVTEAEAGLAPAQVPDGFELAAVAVADATRGGGPEGGNPVARNATQLLYRDGWRRLVVTAWATGDDPGAWDDPIATEGTPLTPTTVLLDGGVLAGTEAELVDQPEAAPHLFAVAPDWVVVVSGDVSPTDLTTVAASLE